MLRRKLVAGESLDRAISAATWNDLLSLLDHRDRAGLWAAPDKSNQPDFEHVSKHAGIWVRNDSGSHLPQFAVVGISAPAVDASVSYGEFEREVVCSVVAPQEDSRGRFAVLIDSIPSGECGKACVCGAVQVKVDIDHEDHEFCECTEGNTGSLKSCTIGSAQILWRKQATGDGTWCIVRLGNKVRPPLYWATLTEDMCVDDTTVTVNELEPLEGCWDEGLDDEVEADNELPQAGCEGDKVLIARTSTAEGEPGWAIINVAVKEVTPLTSAYYASCGLYFPNLTIAVQHCCPDPGLVSIPMYEHTVVNDAKIVKAGYTTGTASGQQVCTLQLQTATDTFCAFDAFNPTSLANHYDPITFSAVHVIVDVTDDTDCIQKTGRWIYVLCFDDAETPEDVICREECVPP